MNANCESDYGEYLQELRDTVCAHCIERPTGGPPCAPLGRICGIEQHVPKLVDICRETNTVQMGPYMDKVHDLICTDCPNRDAENCPCPLEYLMVLAVEAVERVERRRQTVRQNVN